MKKIIFSLFVFISFVFYSEAQKNIKGVVFDLDGKKIDKVKIYDLKHKYYGSTDKGAFDINVPDTLKFLIFEYNRIEKTEFVEGTYLKVYMPLMIVEPMGVRGYEKSKKTYKGRVLSVTTSRDAFYEESSYEDAELSFRSFSGEDEQPVISAGLLTAGEVNDFKKWKLWNDITENQLKQYISVWDIYPYNRYTVQVSDINDMPVINANVMLYDQQDNLIWMSKTDNTGKAELWADVFTDKKLNEPKNLKIIVSYQGKNYKVKRLKPFHKGINRVVINTETKYPKTIEISFVIDITGSMGDEFKYLKAEISEIISKVKLNYPDLNYKASVVVYKDSTDDLITKHIDFTEKISEAQEFMNKYYASGGGDYPEAVDAALSVAIDSLSWDNEARTRIIFLVLDAPPHNNPDVIARLHKVIYDAAKKGIRIVPLTCSGINKSTEYLLRSMALLTNGTYTFLTDDSGIGNPHIKPTTDKYDVKTLQQLMIEIIKRFVDVPTIEKLNKEKQKIQDTTLVAKDTLVLDTVSKDSIATQIQFEDILKFYPNPTTGLFKVEMIKPVKEFFIADITGKLLIRQEVDPYRKIYEIDISGFTNGIYFVEFFANKKWHSGKLILMK